MNLLVEELIEELKAGVKGRKSTERKPKQSLYADYTLIRQVGTICPKTHKNTSKETAEITVGLTGKYS